MEKATFVDPSTNESVETLKRVIEEKMANMDRNYGKSIGFTKPTLEARVKKNRIKEKNRRKVFSKTKNRTR